MLTFLYITNKITFVRRSGGMADAQASGACYGNIVWVQVPSPAFLIGSIRDARKCRNWQTSKTKDLVVGTPCGFKSHLPQSNREQQCSRFFCALAIRHARTRYSHDAESLFSSVLAVDWPYTADAATVPSRTAAQGLVGMANCFI